LSGVVGLLLAAGSASRFGADKLSHPLPHGVAIAAQSARQLRAEVDRLIAAVKPGVESLSEMLREEGCEVVVCQRAAEGMGASLACAAQAAGTAQGYIVALADMPFIRRTTIAAVRAALESGAPLAAPYFHTRRGHPVGIGGSFHDQLMRLGGDEGARGLIVENETRLVKIPVGDPGVIRDIDTPDDLARPARV